jgi:hypothetical protein
MSQIPGRPPIQSLTILNIALAVLLSLCLLLVLILGVIPLPHRTRLITTDFSGSASWEDDATIGSLQTEPKRRALVERVRSANGDAAAVIDLMSLDLSGMQLEEADFITLSSMRSLRRLTLAKTNIQDRDLIHIALLANLEFLDLSATSITDAGIERLKKLSNLRQLELEQTKVTAARIRQLHSDMPGIRAHLYGAKAFVSGYTIQPSVGKFVLVKYGLQRAAFRFTELTKRGDAGAKYVWYWQPDVKAPFGQPPLKQGEGEVFEKYRRVNKGDGHNWLEDDGGELYLLMGPIKLEWSQPNVVYFPWKWENAPNVQMALTSWERFEDIDFDSKLLQWYERTNDN